MRLYLELEDQPDIKTEKTMIEPIQKNIIKEKEPVEYETGMKANNHMQTDNIRATIGDIL